MEFVAKKNLKRRGLPIHLHADKKDGTKQGYRMDVRHVASRWTCGCTVIVYPLHQMLRTSLEQQDAKLKPKATSTAFKLPI